MYLRSKAARSLADSDLTTLIVDTGTAYVPVTGNASFPGQT